MQAGGCGRGSCDDDGQARGTIRNWFVSSEEDGLTLRSGIPRKILYVRSLRHNRPWMSKTFVASFVIFSQFERCITISFENAHTNTSVIRNKAITKTTPTACPRSKKVCTFDRSVQT